MKFIDIIFIILAINLTSTYFIYTGIMPNNGYVYDSDAPIDSTGEFTDPDSLASKIREGGKQGGDPLKYFATGASDTSLSYLQSGGDFIKALTMLLAIFTAVTSLSPLLTMFSVPANLTWIFITQFYFLYALAVYQGLSGKSLGGTE